LKGRIGSRTTEFDIKFTEPWFLDMPLSAGIDIYKWKREYDEYTKDSLGGGLRFGFPIGIDYFTRGLASYYYDDADIFDIDDNAAFAIKEMEGRNVTSSIVLGITRNSKNMPWNTSEGSFNSLSFEYAGGFLGGDVGFDKYLATTAWYFPLPFKTVLMTQGRWGYINQHSDEKLPVYQKFQIGGINTVRGFDYYEISPRDPETGDKIGGEKMMIYNVEYRFPLLKEHGVTGLVFFDAGNVWTKDQNYSFKDLRTSAGPGIRWYSPFGPLRLEYGKNLDPLPGESSGKIEFGVGGLF
jgi:outer membrane protein insertion porin family